MKKSKLLQKVLNNPRNVRFAELTLLLEAFGFRLSRIKGSHHIYIQADVLELINIQDVKGRAKPYQVRQVLRLIERHNLQLRDE